MPCESGNALQLFKGVTPTAGDMRTGGAGGKDGSAPVAPPALTEAVLLDTVVSFKGVEGGADVQHVELSGFRITHAATTQLQQYVVLSCLLLFCSKAVSVIAIIARSSRVVALRFHSVRTLGKQEH